jgi:glucuronate isomerase
MIGNFNDGSIAGKVQFGSGWWFLDQKDGMEKQITALSNMGLLSRFVGMLTDSRVRSCRSLATSISVVFCVICSEMTSKTAKSPAIWNGLAKWFRTFVTTTQNNTLDFRTFFSQPLKALKIHEVFIFRAGGCSQPPMY